MNLTRQCHGCKQSFRKTELVEYFSASGKTSNWYCPKCLEEKKEREYFSDTICSIFGLKSPGPVIWTQRKRLHNKYGYTDATILDCLEYMYKVEHYHKLSETLGLVTPTNVEKMLRYKKSQDYQKNVIASAAQNEKYVEVPVAIRESHQEQEKVFLNPDDFLYD